MKTSIIILTFNKLEYTRMCIESIREHTEQGTYEIIVIDNHSTDETVNWLKEQEDIIVVFNEENVGFSAGCNQGINLASGENILLLNNDTIVTNNWLKNLLVCLNSSEDIGAVGPVTNSCSYYQAIPVSYNSIEGMHQFSNSFNISDSSKWEERLKLVGYCMLIKRNVIEKVGLLDERFSLGNYEDDDYSIRIREVGFKLILCNDTFIHHFGSISFKEIQMEYNKNFVRNREKFREKWGFDSDETDIKTKFIHFIKKNNNSEIDVLELGCGCGGTLLKIKNLFKNANVYGLDTNKYTIRQSEQSLGLKAANRVEEIEKHFPDHSFDYIILSTQYDKMIDLNHKLEKISKYIKPSGEILLEVKNKNYYKKIRSLLHGLPPYNNYEGQFYTLSELTLILQKNGFILNDIQTNTFIASEDSEFVNTLYSIAPVEVHDQFGVSEFFVSAKKINAELIELLRNIIQNITVEINLSQLNKFDVAEIILTILYTFEDCLSVLNHVAMQNYKFKYFNNVLPFLNKAFNINQDHSETLMNLNNVLITYGKSDVANYLQGQFGSAQIDNTLIVENNQKMQIVRFLLQQVENEINIDDYLDQLLSLMTNSILTVEEIFGVINKYTIYKDKLLTKIGVKCFEKGLNDFVIPFLNQSLKYNPTNTDTLFNLGCSLFQYANYEQALLFLNRIPIKDDEAISLIKLCNRFIEFPKT